MVAPKTTGPRLAVALRRAKAMQMRIDGVPPEIIVEELGYKTTAAMYQDVARAIKIYAGRPADELRGLEVARMDAQLVRFNEMEKRVLEVRDREHITVNNGRVIMVADADGKESPLIDDEPVLRATAQLLAIEDRRASVQQRREKMLGFGGATKVAVITDEVIDDELVRLGAEVAELEREAAEAALTQDPEGQEG